MPIKLTKAGLIQRAAGWAQDRGVKFTVTRFNEWMKQALVLEGLRDPNPTKGKRLSIGMEEDYEPSTGKTITPQQSAAKASSLDELFRDVDD